MMRTPVAGSVTDRRVVREGLGGNGTNGLADELGKRLTERSGVSCVHSGRNSG